MDPIVEAHPEALLFDVTGKPCHSPVEGEDSSDNFTVNAQGVMVML